MTRADTQNPHRMAEHVLEHLLHDPEPDPVAIAALAGPGIAVFTNYSTFSRTTRRDRRGGQSEPWLSPRHALNRDDQRSVAFARAEELRRDPEKKVDLLFAYGTRGNHLELLGKQIGERLLGLGTQRLNIRLQTADTGRLTMDSILNDIGKQLGLTRYRTLQDALVGFTRDLPKSHDRGPALLLLDLGAHGGNHDDHGKPLKREDIRELARALRDGLAPACPRNLRIVCILALEVPEDKQVVAVRIGNELQENYANQQFGCKLLKPVDRVAQTDLSLYLGKVSSGCPPVLVVRFARAVFHESEGVFEVAVRLLEEAHAVGWSQSLLEAWESQLPGASPPGTAGDDL